MFEAGPWSESSDVFWNNAPEPFNTVMEPLTMDHDREFLELAADVPVPRRVLRFVLLAHGLGIGSRVLVIGSGDERLVRYLRQLGLDASRSPVVPGPGCSDKVLQLAEQGSFDLVFLPGESGFGENLLTAEAYRRTAACLACVRPSRFLAALTPAGAHDAECLRRHLQGFPGVLTSRTFRPGLAEWMFGGADGEPHRTYGVVSFRVPETPLSLADWLHIAERTAREPTAPACCPGLRAVGPDADRKAA